MKAKQLNLKTGVAQCDAVMVGGFETFVDADFPGLLTTE